MSPALQTTAPRPKRSKQEEQGTSSPASPGPPPPASSKKVAHSSIEFAIILYEFTRTIRLLKFVTSLVIHRGSHSYAPQNTNKQEEHTLTWNFGSPPPHPPPRLSLAAP